METHSAPASCFRTLPLLDTSSSPRLAFIDKLLKRTTSRCPTCHTSCPAEVWRTGGIPSTVLLKRTCAQHGESAICISSDSRFYWLAHGKSGSACCASSGLPAGTLGCNATPGDALGIQEKLSTCLALIEIVNSCNLACPTCYADSPVGNGARVDAVPIEDLKRRIQGVIERKGRIEILQLSGGEPTLHPNFFELLRWLHGNSGIQYVLLNTNGVRIANDDAFARELRETFRYGAFQLYLQFDGPQSEGQTFLRGADLRATRQRCLERCAKMNLPVTLAMTVTPDNLPFLWDAIEFGLSWANVRGICFPPAGFRTSRSKNAKRQLD
jgi:7,8-dihydro-6-hydroxymethylpterin dimethyltransferase